MEAEEDKLVRKALEKISQREKSTGEKLERKREKHLRKASEREREKQEKKQLEGEK